MLGEQYPASISDFIEWFEARRSATTALDNPEAEIEPEDP
jgi:hypothetical protein